jgi:hypothetical protein
MTNLGIYRAITQAVKLTDIVGGFIVRPHKYQDKYSEYTKTIFSASFLIYSLKNEPTI